jgi:addiction module HigA family antidote
MADWKFPEFDPDNVIHPGEILEGILQDRCMKKNELAKRCGINPKTISFIINGKANISPAIAIQLERALGISAEVWINLDAHYRLHVARTSEEQQLNMMWDWARAFPLKQLEERGFISVTNEKAQTVISLLDFFGVANIQAYQRYNALTEAFAFRRSPAFDSSKEAVTAWLRIGELLAEKKDTKPYDKSRFRDALHEIRGLTLEDPDKAWGQVVEICRRSGVALLFVPELPKTHLIGATRWLRPDKALIMLSMRHNKDDFLWFDFYHQAGHVIYHGKKSVFIDETEMGTNWREDEANKFASNLLIDPSAYGELIGSGRFSGKYIESFASSTGIAPGIVVGRLQQDGHVKGTWLKKLRRTLTRIPEE